MAVQYIPNNPSTPLALPSVRRSTRHLTLPPTPATTPPASSSSSTSPSGSHSNRVVARFPTRRNPRQSLATTTPTIAPSTSGSRGSDSPSRSRKRSRVQDEQEEEDFGSPTPSSRTRPAAMMDNIVPITPEPTPRAMRAQKRRKLADQVADGLEHQGSSFSPSLSSSPSSPSLSLSPTTPHPQPISPEPISPTHPPVSAYIVKSNPNAQVKPRTCGRKRKAQLIDDDAGTSSGSDSTPPSVGDPLPRSLTKRRKLDRPQSSRPSRSARVRSKSQLPISTPTPLTSSKKRLNLRPRPKEHTSRNSTAPSPRGANNTRNSRIQDHSTKNVRRSARLIVHTNPESQPQYPSEAQLEESIPLSPLTPPPSDDESDLTDTVDAESSSNTLAEHSEEEEDESEMEMVACIGVPTSSLPLPALPTSPPTSWKSIIPSHISNPILKGRHPPNPALYAQLQLASYRRTKPNTPSPLSLYSYTGGVTPPTSPAMSAVASINSLDAIDDIPPLGEAAAVEAITAIAEGEVSFVGVSASVLLPEQLFNEQQPQLQFYGQGYSQVELPQQQQSEQVFEQPLHQAQLAYRQSGITAPSPGSSNPPPLVDMNFMMMDLQFQMQMGMQGASGAGMHFDQLGFMMGGNAAEERGEHQHMPTTVHMQDVHLHQPTHNEHQNNQRPNQQQVLDVQPNHQLYPYPYFSTEQGQLLQGSGHLYGTQESTTFGVDTHAFRGQPGYQHQHQQQFQPEYQTEYPRQEQPQVQSSSIHGSYGGMHPYGGVPSQVFEQQGQPQQDFQAQQQQAGGDVAPFSSSNVNVGYDGTYQTHPDSSPIPTTTNVTAVAAPTPVSAATTHGSHYTLSMHNALLFFQQALSRFHEDQLLLAHEAADMHTRQLEEFQREKEERKRRLKKTKLVREVQVVPMTAGVGVGSSGMGMNACPVGRAKGLWAVACKARMFEVVRIYTPALIREVTEISAREFYSKMGLKYPSCRVAQSRYRVGGSISEDPLDDPDSEEGGGEGGDVCDTPCLVEKRDEGDGDTDADDDEFRNEKIFDFELLDDDDEDSVEEEEMEMDEVRRQTEEDLDEEMDEAEEDEDEEEEEEEENEDVLADLNLEAMTDPLFQPELSMRITPQEALPSTAGGVQTTFYVPPLEVYAVPEQSMPLYSDQKQDPESQAQVASSSFSASSTTINHNQKQKVLLVNRPVLPFPPPTLSTFRPAALKFYNIDPVHAGRGTPCAKERREVWAGGPLVSSASLSVKQLGRVEDGDLPVSSEGAVDYESGVTAWYAYADDIHVATLKDLPSATSNGAGPGSDPPSDDHSDPALAEKEDSVFGECVGTCCMGENVKEKMKSVEVEEVGEQRGIGEGQELPRVEEEASENDGPTSTSAVLPQPVAQAPPPRHMTVEIPPAQPDRIPHGRRGVLGRTEELLKVYAPPVRSVPSILPLARRPPRPPQLGLDEAEADSVVKSLAPPQAYHPVVPCSWEQVAGAMEELAFQGIDASAWVDGHGHSPPAALSSSSNGTELQVQPTFNPASSELSAALG